MAHRYRMFPTDVQVSVMMMHCSHARAVWNTALEFSNTMRLWARLGVRAAEPESWGRMLTECRHEFDWLRAGSSSVQQQALNDLVQAFKNRRENPARFGRPTWRKAGVNEGFAVRDLTVTVISRRWAEILVPKCGMVKFRLSRPIPAGCKSARVTMDRSGRWHVSLVAPQPAFERATTGSTVGVDAGVAHTVTLSDGTHLDMPDLLTPGERQRLRRLERQLVRQRKGSNRRRVTRHKIACLRARETDRRKDWIEQTTTALVRAHDVIVIEDLAVKNMTKSAKGSVDEPGRNVRQKAGLNREIRNQSWGLFRQRLEQKAAATPDDHRCQVVAVRAAYTSQRCSKCGHTGSENRENQAVFRCVRCAHTGNADVNAALNIHAAGLAVTGRGGTPHRTGDHQIDGQWPDEASTPCVKPSGATQGIPVL